MRGTGEDGTASEEGDRRRWTFLGETIHHGGRAAQAMKTYEGTESTKKRRRGRPTRNLPDVIKKDLEKTCLSFLLVNVLQ